MGPDNLAVDIGIYGPSLFGLLGPSAMTVKPLLFNIFETYLLPLGDKLETSFLGLLQVCEIICGSRVVLSANLFGLNAPHTILGSFAWP